MSRSVEASSSLGYGFAYAAWIRASVIRAGWASNGYHYYLAFEALQS